MDYCDGYWSARQLSTKCPGWLQTRQNCISGWKHLSSHLLTLQFINPCPTSWQYKQMSAPIWIHLSERWPYRSQTLQWMRFSDYSLWVWWIGNLESFSQTPGWICLLYETSCWVRSVLSNKKLIHVDQVLLGSGFVFARRKKHCWWAFELGKLSSGQLWG